MSILNNNGNSDTNSVFKQDDDFDVISYINSVQDKLNIGLSEINTEINSNLNNNLNNNKSNKKLSNYYSIINFGGKKIIEISNEFFNDFNQLDYKTNLIKIILELENNKIVEYIKIPDDLPNDKLRLIYNIIYDNFPIIGINRLEKNDNIININFFGIKDLNEEVGKDVVDKFILGVKQIIISNFDNSFYDNKISNKKGRLILNSYKNLTFSYKGKNDILKDLMGNINNVEKLIDKVFDLYFSDIENDKKNNIKQYFYKYFNIGFSNSKVDNDEIHSKILSYHKVYMGSKIKNNSENFKLNELDILDIKGVEANRIIEIEQYILRNYFGSTFSVNGKKYEVVTEKYGVKRINNKLLSYFRKGGKIDDLKLSELVTELMKKVNENFDFISPNNLLEDIYTNYDEELIKDGYIKLNLFTKNQKGFYNKEYFYEKVKGRNGLNIFIDVVDMSISNINDAIDLSRDYNSKHIDKEELINSSLLGGITGTNKLLNFAKIISKNYPKANICILGDEILIHFDFDILYNSSNFEDPLDFVKNTIDGLDLETRISIGMNGEVLYNALDEYTKINKCIKNLIDKNSINHNVEVLEIQVDPRIKNYLLENIDTFANNIVETIDEKKLKKIINGESLKTVISTFNIIETPKDEKDIYSKNKEIIYYISLLKTVKGYKIIIGFN